MYPFSNNCNRYHREDALSIIASHNSAPDVYFRHFWLFTSYVSKFEVPQPAGTLVGERRCYHINPCQPIGNVFTSGPIAARTILSTKSAILTFNTQDYHDLKAFDEALGPVMLVLALVCPNRHSCRTCYWCWHSLQIPYNTQITAFVPTIIQLDGFNVELV